MRSSSVLLLSAFLSISIRLHAQSSDIQSQTRAFLDAYARGDSKTILAAVDNNTVVYGSDAGEVFRELDSITTMLANDTRLWSNSARIGGMQNVAHDQTGKPGIHLLSGSVYRRQQTPSSSPLLHDRETQRQALAVASKLQRSSHRAAERSRTSRPSLTFPMNWHHKIDHGSHG